MAGYLSWSARVKRRLHLLWVVGEWWIRRYSRVAVSFFFYLQMTNPAGKQPKDWNLVSVTVLLVWVTTTEVKLVLMTVVRGRKMPNNRFCRLPDSGSVSREEAMSKLRVCSTNGKSWTAVGTSLSKFSIRDSSVVMINYSPQFSNIQMIF